MYSERDHLLQEITDLCTNTPTRGLKRECQRKTNCRTGKASSGQWALATTIEDLIVTVFEQDKDCFGKFYLIH